MIKILGKLIFDVTKIKNRNSTSLINFYQFQINKLQVYGLYSGLAEFI